MDNLGTTLGNIISQDTLVSLLGKTLLALILLVVFLVGGRILRGFIQKITTRTSRNTNIPVLLSNLAYVVILLVGTLSIIGVYTDQSFSTLITLLGVLSLAISLSVQDILKNFVAGIYLLLEQPFSIGDRIKVHDMEGKVENIEIRTTTLHTDDGVKVFIPNNIVFSEVVTNRTAYRQLLTTIHFSLPAQEVSYKEISPKILNVLKEFESGKVSTHPAPHVLIDGANHDKISARLNFWSPTTAPVSVISEVILALHEELPQLDITSSDGYTGEV